jgi:hypothetical protein
MSIARVRSAIKLFSIPYLDLIKYSSIFFKFRAVSYAFKKHTIFIVVFVYFPKQSSEIKLKLALSYHPNLFYCITSSY